METAIQWPLYKVLDAHHRSCHGGKMHWRRYPPTPAADGTSEPGTWTRPAKWVHVCEQGYHLTTEPMRWATCGMQVYLAEGRGARDQWGDKTAFAQVRLLRPANEVVPVRWHQVEHFVTEQLPAIPWLQAHGEPDPEWILYDVRSDALDRHWRSHDRLNDWLIGLCYRRFYHPDPVASAMRGVAEDALRKALDAINPALRSRSALTNLCFAIIVRCLETGMGRHDSEVLDRCWNIWRRGYGLTGIDASGRLIVYRRL